MQVGQAPREGRALLQRQPALIGPDGGIHRAGGRSRAPGRLARTDVSVAIGRGPDRPGGVAAQRVEGKRGGVARPRRVEPGQPVAEVVAVGGQAVEGGGRADQVAVGVVGEAGGAARIGAADELRAAVEGVGGGRPTQGGAGAVAVAVGRAGRQARTGGQPVEPVVAERLGVGAGITGYAGQAAALADDVAVAVVGPAEGGGGAPDLGDCSAVIGGPS